MFPVPSVRREPAFNMPGALVGAIVLLLAVQAGRGWLSDISDLKLVLDAGFVPARLSIALGWTDSAAVVRAASEGIADSDLAAGRAAIAQYVVDESGLHAWSPLTYGLLHGSWMHVGLNCVWLAAFGTPVVRRLGPARSLALAVATSLAGALAYWIVNPLSTQVVIGASGAVSGFMGAAALFVFAREERDTGGRGRRGTGFAATFAGLAANRSALLFLAIWLIMNVATGLLGEPLGIVEGGIAWEAHIGGLVAGLLLFPLLDPVAGGTTRAG